MEGTRDNSILLAGRIDSSLTYSHTVGEEDFYTFFLCVPRLSQVTDCLPVTISHKLLTDHTKKGADVVVRGQIRSYNQQAAHGSKLILTVFARSIEAAYKKLESPNRVRMAGALCKKPIYRTTPFEREITDMMLKVERGFERYDYIPVIAWGKHARMASRLEEGERIALTGRMQSRTYDKTLPDGSVETRVAYEVSAGALQLLPRRLEESL